MKKKEKTNIDFLRDIIKELAYVDSEKGKEGLEFLDAIDQEMNDSANEDAERELEIAEERIEELEGELDELKEKPDTDEYFVGLDTIYIGYQHGNLKIQQQVESFIERLQRENSVVPA